MKRGMTLKRWTDRKPKSSSPFLILVLLLIICLTALLAQIIYTTPTDAPGLGAEVARFQKLSGVTSPVTAVLLNFRGYDTLLEVLILLMAVIGVWSLTKAPSPKKTGKTSPVQLALVRLLAPLMCLVAAYLVWQGSHLAGGAFQGGAVLGGAGVLMLVAELPLVQTIPSRWLRIGLVFGPSVFLAVALLCMASGRELLAYPQGWSESLLLLIEAACALSIGLTLASLFAGGRPGGDLVEKEKTHRLPGE